MKSVTLRGAVIIAATIATVPAGAAFATDIQKKYESLGAESGFLGAPTIPEATAPDGVGKYRHFAKGSIYWHPSTGAFVVHGLIQQLWASLGWEKSYLGYPMTDEMETFDGGGRVSKFQGGQLVWRAATNKVSEVKSADLVVFLPFPPNQTWKVGQANAGTVGPTSHGGPWVYCWDFDFVGGSSAGRSFASAGDGRVVYVTENLGSGDNEGNVVIQHWGEGRYASYLHIKSGSYKKHFGAKGGLLLPQDIPWEQRPVAKSGAILASVGDSGTDAGNDHLHFCVTTKPDRPQFKPFESVPVSFRWYQVSSDQGATWKSVGEGVPKFGDWLRWSGTSHLSPPHIAGAPVLNYGAVKGQVSPASGKAGAKGGTLKIVVSTAWGQPLRTQTVQVAAGSAGPWPFELTQVAAFNDLKVAATFAGGWSTPVDRVWGQSGLFEVRPNKTATVAVQIEAILVK